MSPHTQRLHICLGTTCNNHCLFCMEDDRAARAERLSRIDTETARRIISSAATRSEVMFTAGEPTLRRDLPDLIAHARDEGFVQIGIISNGRRFAYAPYLERLVSAGLNYVMISLHGPTDKVHDGLTRTPGSFAQAVAGLRNAQSLRQRGWAIRLVTATVVNRRNLALLERHIRFLETFGPDEVVLNVIQPVGGGAHHFDRLVPRATEVVASLQQALGALAGEQGNVRLLDLPRCVTLALPARFVGFVEEHAHFEPAPEVLPGVVGEEQLSGAQGDALVLVTKGRLDDVLRVKGPDCVSCRFHARCEGVWRRYVEGYGFDEFRPVLD
jgi:MoaA/NifB/PqqE/SkfB family radical SAM enzyme